MFDISASIVLYKNDVDELLRAISSFLNTDLNVRLFLIDNSPTNNLATIIDDPRVEYHYLSNNIGFGSAHNKAFNLVLNNSKYHIVLNPDIYFEKGVLESIYSFMESNEDVGLLMPRICYPDGENQYLCKLLPSPFDLILRKFLPFPSFVEKYTELYQLKNANYLTLMEVPSLSGCFMFLRTNIINKVGGFDERFFMYCEDLDFSRRINNQFKTVYYPNATVYHEFHRDSYKNKKLLWIHISSAIKYFNKWGWVIDQDRKNVNKRTIKMLGL